MIDHNSNSNINSNTNENSNSNSNFDQNEINRLLDIEKSERLQNNKLICLETCIKIVLI